MELDPKGISSKNNYSLMKTINQYEPSYGIEEAKEVEAYLKTNGWLTEFRQTRRFEEELAKFTGAKYCSVVINGTVSLFIALKALGIGRGNEVIVPDITMAATPNAALLCGATPVFVDIEPHSHCIDLNQIKKAISKKTKAVIHVSLNGRAGELSMLKKFCKEKGLHLIEDAAQSLGSFYNGRHLGLNGAVGSFSLSIHKLITTGQGGFVITNNKQIHDSIKMLKDFGRKKGGMDNYLKVGWNFKFTDIQASFGIAQLRKIDDRIKFKRWLFDLYKNFLSDVSQIKFLETDLTQTTPWFVDIMVNNRNSLMKYLKEKGIDTRPVYPALHTQHAYNGSSDVKFTNSYRESERVAKKCLWLPSSFTLKEEDIRYICNVIREYYKIKKVL